MSFDFPRIFKFFSIQVFYYLILPVHLLIAPNISLAMEEQFGDEQNKAFEWILNVTPFKKTYVDNVDTTSTTVELWRHIPEGLSAIPIHDEKVWDYRNGYVKGLKLNSCSAFNNLNFTPNASEIEIPLGDQGVIVTIEISTGNVIFKPQQPSKVESGKMPKIHTSGQCLVQSSLEVNHFTVLAFSFIHDVRNDLNKGDIYANSVTVLAQNIILRNNRIIGEQQVRLEAINKLERETTEYSSTNLQNNSFIIQERAYPQQQIISKGNIKVLGWKGYRSVGTLTHSLADIVLGSIQDSTEMIFLDLTTYCSETMIKGINYSSSETTTVIFNQNMTNYLYDIVQSKSITVISGPEKPLKLVGSSHRALYKQYKCEDVIKFTPVNYTINTISKISSKLI